MGLFFKSEEPAAAGHLSDGCFYRGSCRGATRVAKAQAGLAGISGVSNEVGAGGSFLCREEPAYDSFAKTIPGNDGEIGGVADAGDKFFVLVGGNDREALGCGSQRIRVGRWTGDPKCQADFREDGTVLVVADQGG